MFLKQKQTAVIIAVLMLFTACAKKPEKPFSPSLKIGIEKRGTEKIYIIDFTCTLKNENDSTAFTNVTGRINIKNDAGVLLLEIPFTVETILPFDSGEIAHRSELNEKDAAPLLGFLAVSSDKLESGEDSGARPLDDGNVAITDLKLTKKDIIDILKGK